MSREHVGMAQGRMRMSKERMETFSISLGLGLFGSAVGMICGLSAASGISTLLITTLFSFVGGVVLTYASFQRTRGRGTPSQASSEATVIEAKAAAPAAGSPDVIRTGAALSLLSMGIIAGTLFGMYVSYGDPFGFRDKGIVRKVVKPVDSGTHVEGSGSGAEPKRLVALNVGIETVDLVDRVQRRLNIKFYEDPKSSKAAFDDIHELERLEEDIKDLLRKTVEQCKGC